MRRGEIRAFAVHKVGEIEKGDSVSDAILRALGRQRMRLRPGDILVVKQKIVSKAEGRYLRLEDVRPTAATSRWSRAHHLDPRVTQIALNEARRIVRKAQGVLITETEHGLVCANSGVDVSNVDGGAGAVLLPVDPDRSAARIHRKLSAAVGFRVPVIITDTFGRPWREGLTDVAIGMAGMKPFRDFRARRDPYGYPLRVSLEAVADELAGMASLVCGKVSRVPACVIRGFEYEAGAGRGQDLIRNPKRDLFR